MSNDAILPQGDRSREMLAVSSGHVMACGGGRTERVLTILAVAGVTALTGLGWVLRYAALRQLALSEGMPTWAATLWPFCIDLFVFRGHAGGHRRSAAGTVHDVLLDTVGATPGPPSPVTSWPPAPITWPRPYTLRPP